MTLGQRRNINLLRQNLDALTSLLSPAQDRVAITRDDRKAALHTVKVTAEAGAKVAEAVHVQALTHHHHHTTSSEPEVEETLITARDGAAAAGAERRRAGPVKVERVGGEADGAVAGTGRKMVEAHRVIGGVVGRGLQSGTGWGKGRVWMKPRRRPPSVDSDTFLAELSSG